MLSNLLFRISQYVHDNRARIIRVLLILAAILVAVFLVFAGVGYLKDRQYQNEIKSLNADVERLSGKAKEAQANADELKAKYEAEKAENEKLQAIADAADAALKAARGKTITLKEAYETVRYVSLPADTPVSVESACAELAGLGYRCQ